MAVEIKTVRFRLRGGSFQIKAPKGSQMLRTYQHQNSYWYVDLLAPAESTETEQLDLWLVHSGEVVDMGNEWKMVGHAASLRGRSSYVFQKPAAQPKKRTTKPRMPLGKPLVDDAKADEV